MRRVAVLNDYQQVCLASADWSPVLKLAQVDVFTEPFADDDAVVAALAQAQLSSWVASLPDGLDTAVGEHGQLVSGGQRQRIALARALLFGAPVLVLDEPTVGLERPLADQLLADVLSASGGRSVLLVTHDAADVVGFEETVLLEEGRIVGRRAPPVPS